MFTLPPITRLEEDQDNKNHLNEVLREMYFPMLLTKGGSECWKKIQRKDSSKLAHLLQAASSRHM